MKVLEACVRWPEHCCPERHSKDAAALRASRDGLGCVNSRAVLPIRVAAYLMREVRTYGSRRRVRAAHVSGAESRSTAEWLPLASVGE